MPSQQHEALLLLFRNRPELAAELLRDALHAEVPAFAEARVESADLTDIQPAEYRADLVVLLHDRAPVLGIIVEVQLSPKERKRFAWPAYVANLWARIRCPVHLLVVTADDAVARWAARPIDIGGGSRIQPLVLGPSAVPEVRDEETARRDPELAVLSAIAHGRDADTEKAVEIALAAMAASAGLDPERAGMYCDLVHASLGRAAQEALNEMDPSKYEYQSEFARRYIALGRAAGKAEGEAEGELKGRAEIVLRLVELRFGPLEPSVIDRIRAATPEDLNLYAERVLGAKRLEEVLASRSV